MSTRPVGMLGHASSRRVFLRGGKVVKFYPTFYGYVIHELVRAVFYLIFSLSKSPILLPKRRILNELTGRKILGKFKIMTTKIEKFSLREGYVVEKFYRKATTIDEMEEKNPLKTCEIAKTIGKLTRKLNDKGYYFIDNRASNWIYDKNLIRTDLELFNSRSGNKGFSVFCDVLSFMSSVQNKEVRDKFLDGYGREIKYRKFLPIFNFFVKIYIKATDIIF